jgi:hypothetical protein
MVLLPTIPSRRVVEYKGVMSQMTPRQDFTSVFTTQIGTVIGIPGNYVVVGCRILLLTQFSGPSITSVTLQLGTTGTPGFYAPAYQLAQLATDRTFQITQQPTHSDWLNGEATLAAHDIVYTFTSIGNTLSALTQGEVEITLQYRPV